MYYVLAGALAAVVGLVEQYNRLNPPRILSRRTVALWAVRLSLEAVMGVIGLALLNAVSVTMADSRWAWLIAGASAPAIVRARWLDLGSRSSDSEPGSERATEVPLGPAYVYDLVRRPLESLLATSTANLVSAEINDKLLPGLRSRHVAPKVVADNFRDFVHGLPERDMPSKQKRREITFIDKTLKETTTSDDDKREALVRRAMSSGAHAVIKRLASS